MRKNLLAAILAITMLSPMSANAAVPELTPFDNVVGDVNFDGAIDASDATEALQEYSAQSVGETFFNDDQNKIAVADYNFDNKIDASDATQILQVYSYNSTNDTPLRRRTSTFIVNFTMGDKTTGAYCKTYEEALAWSEPYLPAPVLKKQYKIEIHRCGMYFIDEVGFNFNNSDYLIYEYKTEFYGIL